MSSQWVTHDGRGNPSNVVDVIEVEWRDGTRRCIPDFPVFWAGSWTHVGSYADIMKYRYELEPEQVNTSNISLRDFFAGCVMTGLVSRLPDIYQLNKYSRNTKLNELLKISFSTADEMIKEREKE